MNFTQTGYKTKDGLIAEPPEARGRFILIHAAYQDDWGVTGSPKGQWGVFTISEDKQIDTCFRFLRPEVRCHDSQPATWPKKIGCIQVFLFLSSQTWTLEWSRKNATNR